MKSHALAACVCLLAVSTSGRAEPEVAFLRERVPVTTSSGVVGLLPGTPVTIVSRHGGRVSVKSGEKQFDVSLSQLTTDAEEAHRLGARDAAEQQAARQLVQQQQESAQKVEAQREAQLRGAEQRQRQAPSPPDQKAALEAQIQDIQKQRERLQIELDHVHDQQKGMPPPNEVRYTTRHTRWGNGRYGYVRSIESSPNAEKLAQREKELQKQIDELNYKEKLLRWQAK
jgi:hypothetical protein